MTKLLLSDARDELARQRSVMITAQYDLRLDAQAVRVIARRIQSSTAMIERIDNQLGRASL